MIFFTFKIRRILENLGLIMQDPLGIVVATYKYLSNYLNYFCINLYQLNDAQFGITCLFVSIFVQCSASHFRKDETYTFTSVSQN